MPRRQRPQAPPRQASGEGAGRKDSAPDRHTSKREEGQSLAGVVGHFVHGLGFLFLAAAAIAALGQIFWVVAAAMAGLSAMSLRDGWRGLRQYRNARKA